HHRAFSFSRFLGVGEPHRRPAVGLGFHHRHSPFPLGSDEHFCSRSPLLGKNGNVEFPFIFRRDRWNFPADRSPHLHLTSSLFEPDIRVGLTSLTSLI